MSSEAERNVFDGNLPAGAAANKPFDGAGDSMDKDAFPARGRAARAINE